MNKNDALKKFFDCIQKDDSAGAFAALAFVPIETLNEQDEKGYDMLIRAVTDHNSCSVEALLQDGRCDWSHEEKLHGKRALEIARTYPPDSRICKAFQNNKKPNFIYRNSRIIPCADIYEQILDGRLTADFQPIAAVLIFWISSSPWNYFLRAGFIRRILKTGSAERRTPDPVLTLQSGNKREISREQSG